MIVAPKFDDSRTKYLGLSIFLGGTNIIPIEAGASFYFGHLLTDADIERLEEALHQHGIDKLESTLPPVDHPKPWANPENAQAKQLRDRYAQTVNLLKRHCHNNSLVAGWWKKDQAVIDAVPAKLKKYAQALVVLAKLDLQHSELSEATEGYRKGLMDDHLPHRPMIEVELADAIIRILDLSGWLGLDIGGAIMEKLAYNQQRADHKEENREKPGGKVI